MVVKFLLYGAGGILGFFAIMLGVFYLSKAATSGFYAAKKYYNKKEE